MPIYIRILKGEGEESPRDLEVIKNTILIGRGSSEDVRLNNDSVSRRHCVIDNRDGEWVVIDEDSSNGTYLNGARVHGFKPIKHGDAIEIGEVVLLVGINRPLEEKRATVSQEKQVSHLVTTINAVFLALGVIVCVGVSLFVWTARSYVNHITRPLPIDLSDKRTLNVLDKLDRKNIAFAMPAPATFDATWESGIYYPVPEWNEQDVWTTAVEGREPRIFEGLDVSLKGGNQIALSSYFYATKQYWAHDANDPYGRIHFDLEGWGGLGPRNGLREAPALRSGEFPQYLRNVRIYPSNIRPYEVPGLEAGQIASFTYTTTLHPDQGHPLVYPYFRRVLAGKILPKLESREVVFEGRYFLFFHNGCRYAAIVRGSRSLLSRFPGGIDAIADAYFKAIAFPDAPKPLEVDMESFRKQVAEKSVFMEVFTKKVSVLPDLRYRDLIGIRDLLLTMQAMPEPMNEENAYSRAYFELRDRAQGELEFALQKIYEGRRLQRAPEGVEQLERIRTFLGDYPPPTMRPGQYGYPEWARFYEATMQRPPYVRRR